MASNLRSSDAKNTETAAAAEERVLGDKATGGIDNDPDHVPNVVSGLKAAISNPNTSSTAKNEAEKKLEALPADKGGS